MTRRLMLSDGVPDGRSVPVEPVTPDRLSDRELIVLDHASLGSPGPVIAGTLFISLDTVKTHLRHVFRKLDVPDRAAAVRVAMERRLLVPRPGTPLAEMLVGLPEADMSAVRHIAACYAATSCPCRNGGRWSWQRARVDN